MTSHLGEGRPPRTWGHVEQNLTILAPVHFFVHSLNGGLSSLMYIGGGL